MKRPVMLLFALAIAGFAPAGLQAQSIDRVPATLTLDDAIRLARVHNADYQQATNDAESARLGVRQAWSQFIPSLNGGISFIADRDYLGDSPQFSQTNQTLVSSMTLFDGGNVFRDLKIARAQADQVDASVRLREMQLIADVRVAYYNALLAETGIGLDSTLLKASRDRLDIVEAMMRLVAATVVDVLGAQVDVANQEQSLERARGNAIKRKLDLARLIGLRSDGMYALAGSLPPEFDPAAMKVDSLIQVALQVNPQVKQSELAVMSAENRESSSKWSRLPTLSAVGSYGRSYNGTGFDAWNNLNPNQNKHFNLGLSLSLPVPIFDRFAKSSEITRAKIATEDSRIQLESTRLGIETAVRSAYIDLQNAYHSLQLAKQSEKLSTTRLELAQEAYRTGSAAMTFTNLQSVITRTEQARRDVLVAQLTWVSAWINLELRVGTNLMR